MPVVFTDTSGHRGRIDEGFSVEYAGPVDVEAYVRQIEAETTSTERAIEELILGLVEDLDIEEARRAEALPVPPYP